MNEIEKSDEALTPADKLPFADLRSRLQVDPDAPSEPEPERYKSHAEVDPKSKCEGTFFIVDKADPVWVIECDGCGVDFGVPVMRVDPKRLVEHRLEHSGLPAIFAGKEFEKGEDGQESALRVCRQWLKEYRDSPLPAPALWGPAGRGKSHLLALIVTTLIRVTGRDAMYRSAVQMFEELQAEFDAPERSSVWQRLTTVEILAIDDLAAERLTEWRGDRFLSLLDTRYREERPIVVATNVPPAEWVEAFGDRAASRLKGMTLPLEMGGPDRRYKGEQLGMEEAA